MNVYKKGKRNLWGASIILVMAFSLLMAGTVYAEDGAQPQEPAQTAENAGETSDEAAVVVEDAAPVIEAEILLEDPVEEIPAETGEEIPVVEEVISTEEPVSEEVIPSEPIAEAVDEETDLAEATAVLAENEITLVNDTGEALDLASEDSLDVVSSADPWWMVGAVKYAYVKSAGACPADTSFGVTCFVHATAPITAALQYMDANNRVPTDGILHVEADTYNETTISINGTYGNGYLANLKGLVSEGTSANTFLNANVEIANTNLGFTLSGFTITGALYVHDNLGILTLNDLDVTNSSGIGIQVSNHNGAVNVSTVKSSHNRTYGMSVNNTAGTLGVTVTNSEFSHNNDSNPSFYWSGLMITTNGALTLNGVAACNNDGNGAMLNAVKGTTIKNSVFDANLAVPVMGNLGYGININNTYTTNPILLENVQADNNTNHGIFIFSAANVTLKNVNSSYNGISSGYSGTYIDNRNGSGTVSVTNSAFRQNGKDGLRILSHKNVTLNGITVQENTDIGVNIDNCDQSGLACLGTGTISITGNLPNYFNDNGEYGLQILSRGNVTLSNFQANGNTYSGVIIANNYTGSTGTVTLNVTYVPTVGTWTNTASENLQSGLLIDSFGNISLDKCIFESNGDYGANLDNSLAPTAKTITVKNSSFTDNTSDGLQIDSKGNVTINNVNSYENTSNGLVITNNTGSGSVTISGVGTVKNDFSENGSYGILITSAGVVTLSNASAVDNYNGINIDNTSGVGKAVTLSNVNCSGTINWYNLIIESKGAITLTDVISNSNVTTTGTSLTNNDASSAQNVKITRGQFNDNDYGNGLTIYSLGTVTLSSVQANGNGSTGASIDVCRYDGGLAACLATGGLTISGTGNSFSDNDYYGISVNSRNSVTLSNITVDNNGSSGLFITHNYSNSTGNVTLSATSGNTNSVSNNGWYGISVDSVGAVSLSNFIANNNMYYGTYVTNEVSPTPKNVTISFAVINDNQNSGLMINSDGLVTLSGVQVQDSSKHFWEINDDTGQNAYDWLPAVQYYDETWWFDGSSGQTVTISLNSTDFNSYLEFFDEDWHLLMADDNSGGGENAQISYSLSSDEVYYIRVSSSVTGEYGDYTLSINGSSPTDLYTYSYGAYINNIGGTADVKITNNSSLGYGLDVEDNNFVGLYVYTNGNVTLNGVHAIFNGGYVGASINNSSTENKSVSLTNCYFDGNDDEGVSISSKGNVTWTGGSASKNVGSSGAYLQNDNAATAKTISISNVVFDANQTTGLSVYALGKITLTNVSASEAITGSGAVLDNCRYSGAIPGCQGSGDITISGTYGQLEFNDNSYYGLAAYSRGTISLTNVNASGNTVLDGIYLRNNYENSIGGITVKSTSPLTPSQFSSNWEYGAQIMTNGAVTLANLNVYDNNDSGIYLINNTAAQPTSLSHIKTGGNNDYGIEISTIGAITLDYAEDTGNTHLGISLINSSATTAQPVTVNRTRVSGNTTGYGLYVESKGLVTLNNVISNNNQVGALITNYAGSTADVKILSTFGENVFNDNSTMGLSISSSGDVSLSKVTANWNGNQGVYVDTSGEFSAATVYTYRNTRDGMYITADNGFSISGLQSYNNGIGSNYDGLYIAVNSGSPVNILNSFITGNYGDGISISGNAAPVLTGTCYYGNDINNAGGDMNLRIY